jgi:hypothetical protein
LESRKGFSDLHDDQSSFQGPSKFGLMILHASGTDVYQGPGPV